ncbi:MAG: copper resistance protein B [Sphingomonadaceae bacterium]|nr:copper resistance protein B [Sphingomonadaceae bacterium]
MSRAALWLASAMFCAAAVPATAQSMQGMDHGSMPGMGDPAKPKEPPAKPVAPKPAAPPPASACLPEHAKMGHCVPESAGSTPPARDAMQGMEMAAPPPAPSDAACLPEHARMGHCTPAADTPQPSQPAPETAPDAMPGMTMGAGTSGPTAVDPGCLPEHAKMGHCTPQGVARPAMPGMESATGTDLEPGNAPAPAPPSDWYADRVYPASQMARSREEMMKESGGTTFRYISFDLAEYVVHKNKDSYRFEGEAWFGGDINRFVFKYEGEGEFRGPLDDLELTGVYSRAISPYWNLQAGVRYDVKPDPSRTYAVVAIEGLAPYWFEVTASAFLSNKGELRGRFEGYYDQRITQKLILQPRIEANFSAQTIPELGVGSGFNNLEAGVRLRYEIKKEVAPYIGFEWIRQFGETARFTRANGGQVSDPHFVMGVRVWF